MSFFDEIYAGMGLSDVVLIEETSDEEKSGFQTETETRTVVARNSKGEFQKVVVTKVQEFGPRGGIKQRSSVEPISEAQYVTLAAKGRPVDLSAVILELQKAETQKAARAQLLSTAPRCALHDRKMALKIGKFGKYWGCPKPKCSNTVNLTVAQKALAG